MTIPELDTSNTDYFTNFFGPDIFSVLSLHSLNSVYLGGVLLSVGLPLFQINLYMFCLRKCQLIAALHYIRIRRSRHMCKVLPFLV